MKSLGSMIRTTREQAGITLSGLARAARVSPSYLCRIEKGDRTRKPSHKLLARLAASLELPPDDLFCAAGRVPHDIARWIVSTPGLLTRLRGEMRQAAA